MLSPGKLSHIRLETERLVLREFTAQDEEAVQVYAGDPEVTRYTSWGPNTADETKAVLSVWLADAERLPRTEFTLAIERREDGVVIGGVGFGATEWAVGTANFGYVLRRAAWGEGYATEAAIAMANWALRELGLSRLVAHAEATNVASVRVLRKAGFVYEGDVRLARLNGEERVYGTFVRLAAKGSATLAGV